MTHWKSHERNRVMSEKVSVRPCWTGWSLSSSLKTYICVESLRLRVNQPYKEYQESIPEVAERLAGPRNKKGGHWVWSMVNKGRVGRVLWNGVESWGRPRSPTTLRVRSVTYEQWDFFFFNVVDLPRCIKCGWMTPSQTTNWCVTHER